ncbi:methyl-accepting chemotaxis protein [Tepidibacter sp. Z1-5]|uniref:methyl-accepting chemotaxis protein n=1 Tax=Tepidibacter sp. Z1-5 TaxID=3134138 RepID=UPI0030C173C6
MKFRSFRFKIMMIMSIIILVSFIGVNFIISKKTNKIIEEKAYMEALNLSYKYEVLIKAKMEKALQTTSILASSIDGIMDYGNVDRSQLDDMQIAVLKNNKDINSIFITGDNNGIDGKDIEFAGKEGEMNDGRYITFFVRKGDEIIDEPTEPDFVPGSYYDKMKIDRQPIMHNPYLDTVDGKEILFTSVLTPIVHKGKFGGLVGSDISLDSFQKYIMELTQGNSDLSVSLIANNGTYIANPNSELLGKSIFKNDDNEENMTEEYKKEKERIMNIIQQGENRQEIVYSEYLHTNVYRIYAPIFVGNIKAPWSLVVDTPISKVKTEVNSAVLSSIIITIISLLIVLIFIYIALKQLTKPLSNVVTYLKNLEKGDFTGEMPENIIQRKDEFGILGRAISKMQHNIKDILTKINISFEEVNEGFEAVTHMSKESNKIICEVSKNIDEISGSIVNQSTDIEIISEKANNLGTKINDSNNLVLDVFHISYDTSELTHKGMDIMKLLDARTKESNEKTTEIAKVIQDTSEYVNNAERIIGLINSIADQTNLLALNASIEAARAGEAGKGFSIVAEEIRKLSEETSKATNDIKNLLQNIQGKSNRATDTMNEFGEIVEEQNKTIKNTNEIFSNTSKLLKSFASKIDKLTEYTSEVMKDKEDIINCISNISTATEETATNTEEIATSSEEQLSGLDEIYSYIENTRSLVQNLKREIEKFKIN